MELLLLRLRHSVEKQDMNGQFENNLKGGAQLKDRITVVGDREVEFIYNGRGGQITWWPREGGRVRSKPEWICSPCRDASHMGASYENRRIEKIKDQVFENYLKIFSFFRNWLRKP